MLNECNFIGRLGKDVETRFMTNGDPVSNLTLAVGEKYKDKNTGQMVENVEWVRCVLFKRQSEIAGEYLSKGSLIHVKGKMKTRKWDDKETGETKYSTEIIVDRFVMLGGDQKAADRQQDNSGQSQQAPANNQQAGVTQVNQGFDNFDDDPSIPF